MKIDWSHRQVGIVGFGRFGRLWASLLEKDHTVWCTDASPQDDPRYLPVDALCAKAEVIFLCVPIGRMEKALDAIRPHLRPGTVVFDTCSVKMGPAAWMQEKLGDIGDVTLIATHPMFGPDSARDGVAGFQDQFHGLTILQINRPS